MAWPRADATADRAGRLRHQFRRRRVEHLKPAGGRHPPSRQQHHRGRDSFELSRV